MSESSYFSVDKTVNKEIIDHLFGDESKIPISDIRAYQLPTSFWLSIKSIIKDYKQNKYAVDLFNRFIDQFILLDTIIEDGPHIIYDILGEHLGMSEKEQVIHYSNNPELIHNLNGLNDKLCDHYRENGSIVLVDQFIKMEKSKFSNFKRELIREQYLEWDTLLTDDFYNNDSDFIEYPTLMINRVSLQVYSKDFLMYKGDVRKVVKDASSTFAKEAIVESLMYQKHALSKMSYDQDDIDDYAIQCLPANLDDEYSFIEHRSILSDYNVTSKPKIFKDSYLWKKEGITYRFRHNPPKGAPISLFIFANLQRIVYNKMKEDIPEVEKTFDHELLDENNFIPMGYEKEYLKYENQALEELKEKALGAYQIMLERNGFGPKEKRKSEMIFNISQIEICWNNELPLDPLEYLKDQMSAYHKHNLSSSSFHDNTPLLVTKYMSDIEPNVVRFSHKIYKKTKKNLRNEIFLYN
jgi:hypothetical protein